MLSEISEGRRVKPPSEIYRPGDVLPYTLRGISRKSALFLGQRRSQEGQFVEGSESTKSKLKVE
jgi:hypothetical protein